jgi:hypothetical protein
MLRIICVETNTGDCVFGGAKKATETYRTFDIYQPEIEEWLRVDRGEYNLRVVSGVEMLPGTPPEAPHV